MSRQNFREPALDADYCDALSIPACANCGADLEPDAPADALCDTCYDLKMRAALDAEMEKRWEERTGR